MSYVGSLSLLSTTSPLLKTALFDTVKSSTISKTIDATVDSTLAPKTTIQTVQNEPVASEPVITKTVVEADPVPTKEALVSTFPSRVTSTADDPILLKKTMFPTISEKIDTSTSGTTTKVTDVGTGPVPGIALPGGAVVAAPAEKTPLPPPSPSPSSLPPNMVRTSAKSGPPVGLIVGGVGVAGLLLFLALRKRKK